MSTYRFISCSSFLILGEVPGCAASKRTQLVTTAVGGRRYHNSFFDIWVANTQIYVAPDAPLVSASQALPTIVDVEDFGPAAYLAWTLKRKYMMILIFKITLRQLLLNKESRYIKE